MCYTSTMTRARLGQHWLVDKKVLEQITESIAPESSETIIEIGGGKGALSKLLAPLCRRLIIYEIDHLWASHLREFAPSWGNNVEVREMDALMIGWSREALELDSDAKVVLAGNIPYYISSPLFLRIAYGDLDFDRGLFLIQKEVAERIAAKPGTTMYGRLTVSLGAFLESEILFDVPPEAFKPPPQVQSSLLKIKRLDNPLIDKQYAHFFEFTVQAAFHMRRKYLKNNLRKAWPHISDSDIESVIDRLGKGRNVRAQELPVDAFASLALMLKDFDILG